MGIEKTIVYKDKKKEWRFKLIAGNGKVIAVSSESYKSKRACERAIDIIDMGVWDNIRYK